MLIDLKPQDILKLNWNQAVIKQPGFDVESTRFLADLFNVDSPGKLAITVTNDLIQPGQFCFIQHSIRSNNEPVKKYIPGLIIRNSGNFITVINFNYWRRTDKIAFIKEIVNKNEKTFITNYNKAYNPYTIPDVGYFRSFLIKKGLVHSVHTIKKSLVDDIALINSNRLLSLSWADTNWILNQSKNQQPAYSNLIIDNLINQQVSKGTVEMGKYFDKRISTPMDELDTFNTGTLGNEQLKLQLEKLQARLSILLNKKA